MKILRVIMVLVLVAVSLLTACGAGDSPERAAREWLEALISMDGNKLIERTCAEQHANVQKAGLWASAFDVLGQVFTKFTDQQIKVDISDLRFETVSKSGNTAQVRVTGEIRIAVLAAAMAPQVDATWLMVQEDSKWKWCGALDR
ncbi:MAG: hypothetical protein U9R11_03755 [Chloroflexota bacterium]|nr:hypothetical protein [Chloroflexota bacterium]